MALFDKEPLLGAFGKEPSSSWKETENKEREMINGIDSFLENPSQRSSKKSVVVMEEWKSRE
jgi:hypothetical protein